MLLEVFKVQKWKRELIMFKRLFSKTPPFFKIIRNISIMVTALSVTTLFQENENLKKIAEIVGAISLGMATVSQTAKEDE